jgi:hypothetical protein
MKNVCLKSAIWQKAGLTLLLLLMTFSQVQAQGLNSNAGSGTQLFCKRDFSNFLTNGIDFDGEGFLEYWTDILVTYNSNYCRYQDIDSLLNQIDKARKQIRQAFYVCDNATSSRVAAQYNQLSAELYYLRHFVDTAATPNPKVSDTEKAQKIIPNPDIRALFMKKFVTDKKYFDQPTGLAVFERISQKYASKLESYRNCVDPNLEQLYQRIDNLKTNLGAATQLWNKFKERTKSRFSAMQKRIDANPGLISAFGASSVGDFFNRVVDLRINAEPVGETTVWEQITFAAKENAPLSSNSNIASSQGITFNSVQADMSDIKARTDDGDMDLQYVSEYDLKYRQVQGIGLDKVRDNLDTLKDIIKNTFDPLDKVRICTANIVGKQCGK